MISHASVKSSRGEAVSSPGEGDGGASVGEGEGIDVGEGEATFSKTAVWRVFAMLTTEAALPRASQPTLTPVRKDNPFKHNIKKSVPISIRVADRLTPASTPANLWL